MKSSGSRRDAVRERPSAFISHSSLDLPFARRLADRLQGQGVDVWLDDMQLKAGDALTTAISLALEQHDFVIVILSKASLASDWVRKEMKLATKRASRTPLARLVPVLLERKAAARLPRMLRDTKYVDFSDQKTFEIGLAQLLDLMGRGSPAVGRRSHLERIEFIRSERLSAALRRNIERILIDYQAYLKRIGFRSRFGAFEIAFEQTKDFISYYDPQYDRIVTNDEYAGEEDYLRRDYTHHALSTARGDLWTRAQRDWTLAAIESGLAAYFPCSFKGNHLFGDGAAHIAGGTAPFFDLTNTRGFGEIKGNSYSVATTGLEVWAGAFWELRAQAGVRIADRLLWRAWSMLKTNVLRSDADFLRCLLALDREAHNGRHAALISGVFRARGLKSGRPRAGAPSPRAKAARRSKG
jgi:hypothetical protein